MVSYDELLGIFWDMHDPTRTGGQGDYTGSQYGSTIFWHTEEQEAAAIISRDRLAASGKFGDRPIVTGIVPAPVFWPAEECHQGFYEKCGQGYSMTRQVDE
jgi:peptide-methionine (S)-S-oxide reductase